MNIKPFLFIACAFLLSASPILAADPSPPLPQHSDPSLRHEVEHSIDQGLAWLQSAQNTNGWWSTADHPAVTALALSAFMGEPSGRFRSLTNENLRRGYRFILSNAKPDGSIYSKGLQNYNTSLCVMGLLAAHNPVFNPVIRNARHWIMTQQVEHAEPGTTNSPFDGGVGYGDKPGRSDMNNTFTALEALYYSKYLDKDQPLAGAKDLNWSAAIHFIQSCQNLPAYNKQPWASDDPRDLGGFIYIPGESKAGAATNADGRVAFRSYGSISYAGLLSYIYADLKRDDPRVQAAFDWLRNNYTLDENPGMGPQGLYYYLHLMSKALTVYGVDQLTLKNGQTVDWRKEAALKFINLQKNPGFWANDNGRWWEKDPALVTSYSVIALEIIDRGL